MSYKDDEEMIIDWENPFDVIRSSEIDSIELTFLDNGVKVLREDEKGELYTQYRFKCVREDISIPSEITYITSSKRLIEALTGVAPLKDKTFLIKKSGSSFQTQYKISESS